VFCDSKWFLKYDTQSSKLKESIDKLDYYTIKDLDFRI
jgi:hypothetical protein